LYRRKDVELLLLIKRLLYEKRFTIEGARQNLQGMVRTAKEMRARQGQQLLFPEDPLPEIRRELAAILEILK
jgi:DNA-binding transcriptional MerR regulator